MLDGLDERSLAKELSAMTPQQRAGFALATAERLLPNYAFFERAEGWGNSEVLREVLDLAWTSLLDSSFTVPPLGELRQAVEEATPDTEEFDTVHVSSALDAATAAASVLDLLEDGEVEHAVSVATMARDSVDMYVQELEDMDAQDPRLEQRILEHDLMQKELRRQREQLARLRACVNESDWQRFATDCRAPKVGSLELS